jgi:molybdopterin molybdotransferase
MAGAPAPFPELFEAPVAIALPAGGSRTEYLRAMVDDALITPFRAQDSGMVLPLSQSNALIVHETNAPAKPAGASVHYHRVA